MQYLNIIFVCNEELKGDMQGYSLSLLGSWKPTKAPTAAVRI